MCQGVNVTVHPTGLQGQFQGSCEWPRPPARVPCWARGGQGTPDALHQGHGGSALPEGDALPVPSAAPGVGLGAEERGLTCHRPGSPTGEGGNSMHVCFVGTDYSNLVLYVRLEDAGEVTSLWALLGRWWLSPTPGRLPSPVLTASGSRAAQSCTPVGIPARTAQSLRNSSSPSPACFACVLGAGTLRQSRNPPLSSPGR